ncbi:MAG: AraC family transcriptional regulator [Pseudomonadota bacterium]
MQFKDLADKVSAFVNPNWGNGVPLATGLRNMSVTRYSRETDPEIRLDDPRFCLILQGRQHLSGALCDMTVEAGQTFISSHLLPLTAHVPGAQPKSPCLMLNLTLDISVLRSLYDQIGDTVFDETEGKAIEIGAPDDALIDALGRYFQLAGKPWEANVMAPLILKELHFRLLMATHGGMLRQLLVRDSPASRMARAIAHIKRSYRTPMTVAEMAKSAGLGPSAFFGHFKSITGTTPLQYQKDLRLIHARRMIGRGECTVTAAAAAVGYESATQFSREYARKFGASPRSFRGGIRVAS